MKWLPNKVCLEKKEIIESFYSSADEYVRLTDMLTGMSEYENFRKRNAETRHTSYMEGRADVIIKILPIGDNLERALTMCDENTKKGIEMVLRSFKSLLEAEGIEEINPVNEEFDPKYCEAIMSEPAQDGVESGYVKEVFLKGYKRGEKVLRYAQVKVTG